MTEQEKEDACKDYGCPQDCGCCPIWAIINQDVEVGVLDF